MRRLRFPLALALLAALGGCSLFGGEEDPVEQRREALKLPPDLSMEQRQDALRVPGETQGGAVTASGAGGTVVPQPRRVSVQRVGGDRWITVDAPPRRVWGWLGDYLEARGVAVARRQETLGILETEWLFTRKPVTRGAFAPTLPGPERATVADRYLLRVEPGRNDGTTDVFVAHRRTARQSDDGWRLLGPDPFLEAEVLRGLMVYLGVEAEDSFQRVASAQPTGEGAELGRGDDGRLRIRLPGGFFDAWRRVGLALDRAAFTVTRRERAERFVEFRYDTRARTGPEEQGFFESLAFWRDEPIPPTVERFRLSFAEAAGGEATRVTLLHANGDTVSTELSEEILGLLAEQIR